MDNSLVLLILCFGFGLVKTQDGFFMCPSTGRPIPTDYLCDGYEDCADGADEENCGSGFQCEAYETKCASGGKCVNLVFRCDGLNHCPDGSDELDCETRQCQDWEHTCENERCIPELFMCDGYDDCGDNSDEKDCSRENCNSDNEWECEDGDQCIAKNWICDYERDCVDGSDEENCDEYINPCGIGLFNCTHSKCISGDKLCDGFDDCGDLTDEDESICYVLNCNHNQFACPDKCIDGDGVCDGEYDCIDNSDEINCDSHCKSREFQCIEGTCISNELHCNGVIDCTDSSDEFLCPTPQPVQCSIQEYPCMDRMQCIPDSALCDGTEQCDDGSDELTCPLNSVGINECNTTNGGCDHICHDTKYSHYCSCYEGYHLNTTDLRSCIDTNECDAYFGVCSQYCKNTVGNYSCFCAPGFVESPSHGCKASGTAAYLLFTNWFDIQRVNTRGVKNLDILISHLRTATAIDYHYNLGLIFWSDVTKQAIMRARLNGTEIRTVVDYGLIRPEGLAVDWIHNHIYWTDTKLKRIEVANINGGQRTILFSGINNLRDIIVDPINRWIYWTESKRISRSSLDGTDFRIFLSEHDQIYWPTGLTLDYYTQTLYWIDTESKTISLCKTDGRQRRLLYSENIIYPFGLTVFEDELYWTDRSLGKIFSINKRSGENFREVLTGIYKPIDVVAIHPLKQPYPQDIIHLDPCSINNGGCEYLCLRSAEANSSTCLCPPSLHLLPQNNTCSKPNLLILFSMVDSLRMISLEIDEIYDVELPIANAEFPNMGVIDWDSKSDEVFWADSSQETINSVSISGASQKILIDTDISLPTGLAFDWLARKLYWTDAELSRIYVSEQDGSLTTVVFSLDDGGELTDIVVHPLKGLMYFGVRGVKSPYIAEATLNGTFLRKVIEMKEDLIPAVLSIDYSSNRLYWVDSFRLQLESVLLNGSDHEILLDIHELSNIRGLTNYENRLYWTEGVDDAIRWVDKYPPYETGILIKNRINIGDISIFHRNREEPSVHPCWENNGKCSHLCLAVSSSGNRDEDTLVASCKCSTGYLLQNDGLTCQPYFNNHIIFGSDNRIGIVSLDTQSNVDVTLKISPPPKNILSLDYDLRNDYIYWIDESKATIYRAPAKGGTREVVIATLIRPTSLAIDWMGGNLYFADSGTQRIEVSRLDGSSRRVLQSGNDVGEVTFITVDLKSQSLYWSSDYPLSHVIHTKLDGENPTNIIRSPQPVAIAIDNRGINNKIYVADNARMKIMVYNSDGSGQNDIISTDGPIAGIAVDDTYVYWANKDTEILYRALKSNGKQQERVNLKMNEVRDLRIVKRSDWLSRESLHYPCNENLPCSNLCLPNLDFDYYKCACPTGITDHQSCPTVPSLYLLFATGSSIRRVSQDTQYFYDVPLISELSDIYFIDYHLHSQSEGEIFWSDRSTNSIMASDLNGNDIKTLISGLGIPDDLSTDWITGNIYFIDLDGPRIEVASGNGSFRKVLVDSGLDKPTGLVVHPPEGLMFWLDQSKNPSRIEMSNMDGSNRSTLINLHTKQPVQLTIDTDEDMVYWINGGENGSIEGIRFDGTQHVIVANVSHPFGITAYGGNLFWGSLSTGEISRASKHSIYNKQLMYVNEGAGIPRGLAFVTMDRNGEINKNKSASTCAYQIGGCKYLCLPISSEERTCACPDNLSTTEQCTDYTGIPPKYSEVTSIEVTSTYFTVSTSSIHRVSQATYSQSPSTRLNPIPTSSVVVINPEIESESSEGFSKGVLSILVLIGILIIAIIFVLFIIIGLFFKYKSIATEESKVHATTSLMVRNPLYSKTPEISAKSLGFTPNSLPKPTKPSTLPNSQLNNTKELRIKHENVVNQLKTSNLVLQPVPLKGKKRVDNINNIPDRQKEQKILNSDALAEQNISDEINCEEPEEYKITPVQSRRQQSSVSSPPASPKSIPVEVHSPTPSGPISQLTPKTYKRPPPQPPVEQPSPILSRATPKGSRRVQFATPNPPPIPPRPTKTQSTSPSPRQSPPPPHSAPPTSPPPSFFKETSPPLLMSASNPLFRMESTSPNDDSETSEYDCQDCPDDTQP